ncbi:MAG: Coenzyme F420 hydrogenase/dehydrogenase, beta subunit C-terminal domain [Archaeoglobaceae archaeon]|nr:Coenzyme F420 hydrogenase/dehydrogenase, beta subunit C-terminal domain [Archaeoglobaceae archaeon]MDW8117599.1 Coenzyme F420 hydrogenase/dehydrogenase, beta subunit C-terminal domain [Archaeoglobaceae archaeon]
MQEWRFVFPEKKHKIEFFGNLKAEVIDASICCHCAACSSICPVEGISAGDKPIDFPNWEEKCVDCGACIKVCPRWNYKPLSGIGKYIEAISAKSKRFKGQDGAMVTEITATAMDMGLIEKAIFVCRDEEWRTTLVTIHSPEQLYERKITGTKYCYADALPALKNAILQSKSVAFVGTPCMVSAVKKMQKNFKKFERVKIVIGLFCTENFYHHQLSEFLLKKSINMRRIAKTDIKKGKFIVHFVDGEKVSFSVKELEEIIPPGCKVCQDFSAIESDVSVGSVGSESGFSTVLIRNETAKRVMDFIREKGTAEIKEPDLQAVQKLCDYKIKIHPYPKK